MLYFLMLHDFDIALTDVALLNVNVPLFHILLVAVAIVFVSLFNVPLL